MFQERVTHQAGGGDATSEKEFEDPLKEVDEERRARGGLWRSVNTRGGKANEMNSTPV